jgi:hypothetical protein
MQPPGARTSRKQKDDGRPFLGYSVTSRSAIQCLGMRWSDRSAAVRIGVSAAAHGALARSARSALSRAF